MGSTFCEKNGIEVSLNMIHEIENKEHLSYYLKGCVESLNASTLTTMLLHSAILNISSDSVSLTKLMQQYALQNVFFADSSFEELDRLNRTLNINWALKIKKSFTSVTTSLFKSVGQVPTTVIVPVALTLPDPPVKGIV